MKTKKPKKRNKQDALASNVKELNKRVARLKRGMFYLAERLHGNGLSYADIDYLSRVFNGDDKREQEKVNEAKNKID